MTKDGEYPLQFLLDVQQGKVRGAKVRDRVAVADILLSRGYGKATQLIESDVQHTYERPYKGLSPDTLAGLIYITSRLGAEKKLWRS